ncbi:hypothetical protein BDW72DRAFT_164294 [Aspergillus terricola var. indicus]
MGRAAHTYTWASEIAFMYNFRDSERITSCYAPAWPLESRIPPITSPLSSTKYQAMACLPWCKLCGLLNSSHKIRVSTGYRFTTQGRSREANALHASA